MTRLAKQIGNIESLRVPAALDMAFVGVAGGSPFVGFSAVRQLAPAGNIGISDIELLGRQVDHESSLTTDTRRTARKLLAERASEEAPVEYIGTVRELDLDLARSRFETWKAILAKSVALMNSGKTRLGSTSTGESE